MSKRGVEDDRLRVRNEIERWAETVGDIPTECRDLLNGLNDYSDTATIFMLGYFTAVNS